MTRYAFTGPSVLRAGERAKVAEVILGLEDPSEIITGCCAGVDSAVAVLCAQIIPEVPQTLVVPTNAKSNVEAVLGILGRLGVNPFILYATKPSGLGYRERNTMMVERGDELVAFLRSPVFYRSGEWMTVNIAKELGVGVLKTILGGEVP